MIFTEEEYDEALARAYDLMQVELKEDSAEFDELRTLSILIEVYENEYYPVPFQKRFDNS